MKVISMRYLVLLLAFLSASCTSTLPSFKPYHLDVQQGNVVTSKMMLQLKPGMSKSQVRYVMGTPLLQDSFHQDRWDYLYQMSKGGKLVERRRVILEFKNDGLANVRGDVIAAGAPGAENAPMASIDDIKTAKSDKTLLAEDAKSSWTDRFKFWAEDDKKQGTVSVESINKANVEPEKSWFDSLKFWGGKEKAAAPIVAAKPVEMPKVVEPVPMVLSVMPQVVEQSAVIEEVPQQNVVEPIQTMANEQAPQKVVSDAVPLDPKLELAELVSTWADAWRNKDINAYLKFYSDNFVPDGMSRKTWVSQRKQKIAGQAGKINLVLEKVSVNVSGKNASVGFIQHYSNGRFSDDVVKVLNFMRENEQWLIVKESVVTKPPKLNARMDAPQAQVSVENVKPRDVTADEKSEAMPDKIIQESAKQAQELSPVPMPIPAVNPEPVKAEPVPAQVELKPIVKEPPPVKTESNKVKPLPPEDAPGYFERMLEKIGF